MKSVLHTRPASIYGEPARIVYGLQHLRGNALPYFTVTVDARNFGGCMHDEVLAVAPDLAPLVALHLSGANGEPMHAEANGWYWLAGAIGGAGQQYHGANGCPERSSEQCLALFASHVRIPLGEARAIAERAASMPAKEAREQFRLWCAMQEPRWADEARAAIEAFNLQGWDK